MSGVVSGSLVRRSARAAAAAAAIVLVTFAATSLAQPPNKSAELAVFIRVVGANSAGDIVPIAGASVRAYPAVAPAAITNANGEAVSPVDESVVAGDTVHVVVHADGYQSNDLRYLVTDASAVRVLKSPSNPLVGLLLYVTAHKATYTTIALLPGSDPAGEDVQLTVQVKDSELNAVPGALVQFCCSGNVVWREGDTDSKGENTSFVPSAWIENGLQIVAAKDGLIRYSEVPTSVLDASGERLFLITLPAPDAIHPWAGDWKDSFGAFGLRWLPADQFVTLPDQPGHAELWDKLKSLCSASADYYEGGYNDPGDTGKIVGCAAAGGKLLIGRYLSDVDGHGGTFAIQLSSSTEWSGTYRDDGKPPAKWSGTFEMHFQGDGANGRS
jgi:hypothetical protein